MEHDLFPEVVEVYSIRCARVPGMLHLIVFIALFLLEMEITKIYRIQAEA
jgi:hypothetical protein